MLAALALGLALLLRASAEEMAAADHLAFGWGFFSAVALLLVPAGLPFRDDRAAPVAGRPRAQLART